jgi:hypothetical protein
MSRASGQLGQGRGQLVKCPERRDNWGRAGGQLVKFPERRDNWGRAGGNLLNVPSVEDRATGLVLLQTL